MKITATLSLIVALSASSLALAQPVGAEGMKMNGTGTKKSKNEKAAVHTATAVVKKVDAANGKVMLSHGPIESLSWPAMTMGFVVKDKALFEKLTAGKKISVDILKQGSDYVVIAVK